MSELIPGTISMSLGSKVYHDLNTRLEKSNMDIRTAITELYAHKNGLYHVFYSAMYYAALSAITQILKDISTYDRDSDKIGGKRFYDEEDITTYFATCVKFNENYYKINYINDIDDNIPSPTHLPESIGLLQALTTLEIKNIPSPTYLPESIGNLPPLTTLDIQYCKNVPGSFHQVVKNAKTRAKLAYRAHFNAAASATTATDPAFTAAAAHAATTKHDLNLARARAAARH